MAFAKAEGSIVIERAQITRVELPVVGTAPLVINKFSAKAKAQIMATMATPAAAKKAKTARPPRDYDADFKGAQHVSVAGWCGFSAGAIRSAMVDACRSAGVPMTRAKQAVFIVADGYDVEDGVGLVRILSAKPPERTDLPVRNDNGSIDIRVRPMWREWSAVITVEFDASIIDASSVAALLDRAGRQVGVGEGRPYSKDSCGMGWGTFRLVADGEKVPEKAAAK